MEFYGWPIIITGKHRKEQIDDQRSVMLNIIYSNYNTNRVIENKFCFIQNLGEERLKEFIDSEACMIDPFSTAFAVKFLIFYLNSESMKKYFPDPRTIILNCIKTLLYLYEKPINRNTSRLELAYGQSKIEVFDGTEIPMLDGSWMNFEYPTDPSKRWVPPD